MSKPILSAFADEYKTDFDGQLEGLSSFGIDYLELRFVNGTNVAALTDDEHIVLLQPCIRQMLPRVQH